MSGQWVGTHWAITVTIKFDSLIRLQDYVTMHLILQIWLLQTAAEFHSGNQCAVYCPWLPDPVNKQQFLCLWLPRLRQKCYNTVKGGRAHNITEQHIRASANPMHAGQKHEIKSCNY